MAFNRPDTDSLYENQIKPVLRRNGITPVIINRRQSNEDLNNQIIRQLLTCDFCVADLTYTRPSVYFEAGFAQRQAGPEGVVYTVREDHLEPGAPPDRRVHFDLQMKPLITWAAPDDLTFGTQLEKRLRATVLREWLRKQKVDAAKARAEQQFSSLPVTERIRLLQKKAFASFRKMGFGGWGINGYKLKVHELREGERSLIQAIRRHGRTFDFVSIQSYSTVTRLILQEFRRRGGYYRVTDRLSEEDRRINQVRADHVVLCLQAIPAGRIESVFTDMRRGLEQGEYQKNESHTLSLPRPKNYISPRSRRDSSRIVEYVERWHFIGPIRSRIELNDRLQELRERIV